MRNPEHVLNILAEHSNESSYKYERLYRILFNEQMFLVAYQRIHAKPGNMTPGTDRQTEDGMSIDKVHALIDSSQKRKIRLYYCIELRKISFPAARISTGSR